MKRFRVVLLICCLCSFFITGRGSVAEPSRTSDVLVYGGTPSGIAAAVAASEEGAEVLVVEPSGRVGGRFAVTLGPTEVRRFPDTERADTGLFRRYRKRVNKHYGHNVWCPEPHVSQRICRTMLKEAGVDVVTGRRLSVVSRKNGRIQSMRDHTGRQYRARVFVDTTYEGDLMAAAGVPYTIRREGREKYGESLAGVQYRDPPLSVSAFDADGLPIPHVSNRVQPSVGVGDHRTQAANLLMCITRNPENRVEIDKPASYNPDQFELLRRWFKKNPETSARHIFAIHNSIPNGKRKVNHSGTLPLSTALVGGNARWAEANYKRRRRIYERHRRYVHQLWWFLQHDDGVPEQVRESMRQWGLCRDEFSKNNHWPPTLYVRETRRMVGNWVVTQSDLQEDVRKEDSIAVGGFPTDSHPVQRVITPDGRVINEGRYFVSVPMYEIPYRVLLPRRKTVTNLLVPVCMSASRVAYNSMRVEPTWMALGEAAGVASARAHSSDQPVQDLKVDDLQKRLRNRGATVSVTGNEK